MLGLRIIAIFNRNPTYIQFATNVLSQRGYEVQEVLMDSTELVDVYPVIIKDTIWDISELVHMASKEY